MCGILGSVNLFFDKDVLDLIKHRGPDDFGLERFEFNNNKITFGHRRLSIVDLSPTGHQPMSSSCGNYLIVFNGEIYNHLELRKELTEIDFKGHSDSETIVNYISKFGIESVKKFNGIFAFAVLDKRNNSLYIVRDRFGVKPIYYYHNNNEFVFSSELKPVKKLAKAELDKENLALMLRLRYTPSPYTLFDNIKKVIPGHIIKYDLESYKTSVFSYIEPVKIDNSISFDDALEKYGTLFENGVKRQLMSDVDVGILLSGGIDSALVAYYATKHYDKKMKTFTVGFKENDDANEVDEARETANILGTEHFEVLINDTEFDDVFKKLVKTLEEPLGTTSTIPLYYLSELVSKHVKVVLSGQGADEPLGGYPRYQGELYLNHIPQFLIQGLSVYEDYFKKKEKIARALYALGEENIVKRFDNTYAMFKYDEINNLIHTTTNKSLETINYFYKLLDGKNKKPVEALMSNDLRMNLSDDLLLCADKIAMNFSVEGRVPMLDNELVDFMESLPYKYRLDIKKGKIIHKKFAESVLPKEIVYRPKKGFKTPTEKWFKEKVGAKYYELLCLDKNSKFANYFDLNAVKDVFDQHIKQGINKEKQLFSLISLYYWMQEFC